MPEIAGREGFNDFSVEKVPTGWKVCPSYFKPFPTREHALAVAWGLSAAMLLDFAPDGWKPNSGDIVVDLWLKQITAGEYPNIAPEIAEKGWWYLEGALLK